MSQEKVDKYKQEKTTRKRVVQQEKKERLISRCITGAICIAFVAWIGLSAYAKIEDKAAATKTEVSLNAISEYMESLDSEETE